MQLLLVDAVTGEVLHARRYAGATGPVALVAGDNWLAHTYWNAAARRPEIASAVLLEGAVDKSELVPWKPPAYLHAGKASLSVSAFESAAPFVAHRTYILPLTVLEMAATRTRHGVTAQALLLSTSAGGLLLLDRRLVDPRRPAGEPSAAEKAEGLAQYSPVLPLRHQWFVTHRHAVGRPRLVASEPSAYESTTFVALYGVDEFVARVAPAKAFDQLDPDFNKGLFAALLAGAAASVLVLRRMVHAKDMAAAWK